MQIICISSGSQSRGKEYSEKLAAKLGYECICRDQLLEEARRHKIPIGRLEMAIIKPHVFSENLAVELEHYKALATSILCEKALKNNIVYNGRTGHLLLPGVDHILKIRIESDMEYRLNYVMQKFNLSRKKARQYIEQIDDDRRRWVKRFYNVRWDVFSLYDVVINLSRVHVDNAASASCSLAQLPEFQATPASISSLRDLLLASKARLLLVENEKTRRMNIKVRAHAGIVYITYLAQQLSDAGVITKALQGLDGAREIVCTEADTSILWIQEKFQADDSSYNAVFNLAKNWGAAVELIKFKPDETTELTLDHTDSATGKSETWDDSGILEEREDVSVPEDDADISTVYEKLIKDGRAAGWKTVQGSQKTLLNAIDRSVNYRFIIFDNVFLQKGKAARTRFHQEWMNLLGESLKVPVITLADIARKYRFGAKQFVRMVVFGALTALLVALVFIFSDQILAFLSREEYKWRILATLCIAVFIPLYAYIYSTATGLFLKMLKLE